MAKNNATVGPSVSRTAECAPSMESVSSRPCRLVAATSTIERFTVPATSIANPTSMRVTRSNIRRRGPASGWPCRSRASPECRYTACGITVAPSIAVASSTLSAPSKRGTNPSAASAERRRFDEQAGQESDRDDEQQAADHPLEHPLTAAVLHGQQQQRHRAGDDAADEKRKVEQAGSVRSRRRRLRRDRLPWRPFRPATSSRCGWGSGCGRRRLPAGSVR